MPPPPNPRHHPTNTCTKQHSSSLSLHVPQGSKVFYEKVKVFPPKQEPDLKKGPQKHHRPQPPPGSQIIRFDSHTKSVSNCGTRGSHSAGRRQVCAPASNNEGQRGANQGLGNRMVRISCILVILDALRTDRQ